MKRLLTLLIATTICVASFILPTAAASTDSLHLNSDEQSQLSDISPDDTIVKLFCGAFMHDFAEQNDIKSITARSEERTRIMYLIKKSYGGIEYRHNYHGEIIPVIFGLPDWSTFYEYAVSPNKVFDPSVQVNEVYCLEGSLSIDGAYIYYSTDKGDYVLFKEFLNYNESYLFPISDFYEFASVVYSDRLLHKDEDGGGTEIDKLFDVENYLFKPKSVELSSPEPDSPKPDSPEPEKSIDWITIVIIISVILIAVIGILFFVHRKKSKKTAT